MTVKTVLEKISTKGDKNAILMMEDGREIWTPEYDKAVPLLGKEIPADWYQDEGQYGPRAFPPRPKGQGGARPGGGGGKATWYNSEEGTRYTQERMDRRTALMQAREAMGGSTWSEGEVLRIAELFYDWLRETSPAVPGSGKAGVAEKVVAGEQTNSPAATTYPNDWPRES